MENGLIQKLQEMYDKSASIVFFGGAGGLYRKRNPRFSQQGRFVQSKMEISAGADYKPHVF